jgi:hypothetical protein
MKAHEIRKGDELAGHYEVKGVKRLPAPASIGGGTMVEARVEYLDGGQDFRHWLLDDEVPLTRPIA